MKLKIPMTRMNKSVVKEISNLKCVVTRVWKPYEIAPMKKIPNKINDNGIARFERKPISVTIIEKEMRAMIARTIQLSFIALFYHVNYCENQTKKTTRKIKKTFFKIGPINYFTAIAI